MDGAHEISQIIASGSLGWATACIGHTEICANFKEMFGHMLWVWLKGPEDRFRCETAHNMSITWPITWPITFPITWPVTWPVTLGLACVFWLPCR